MLIFPAIDLYAGQAVRLLYGDYQQMTVYDKEPWNTAAKFKAAGAQWIHLVDLEGAKQGKLLQLELVRRIKEETGLLCELGGGIRDMASVEAALEAGLDRIILGTAAVKEPDFLKAALDRIGDKLAVSVDLKDGFVATHGWQQQSELRAEDFFAYLAELGLRTLVVTDISRDGAMRGTNLELYKRLSETYELQFIASGGVSSMDDIRALKAMKLYGAIIGKAYYSGAIDLAEAIACAEA